MHQMDRVNALLQFIVEPPALLTAGGSFSPVRTLLKLVGFSVMWPNSLRNSNVKGASANCFGGTNIFTLSSTVEEGAYRAMGMML